jgi:RimJ/RimL family protein N-acetyltransferase
VQLTVGDLVLRPPERRDLAAIVDSCRDPDIARFIPVIPVPYETRHAEEWLSAVEHAWRETDERTFAIVDGAAEELLGAVTVRLHEGGSVGYWLRPSVRGRGIMTRAVRAIVDWAVEEHGIGRLVLTTHPDNVASQRVAERAGFSRLGVLDDHPAFQDGTTSAVLFELRRSSTVS